MSTFLKKTKRVIQVVYPSKVLLCRPLQIMFVQMVFSLVFMRREFQATIGMLNDKLIKRKTGHLAA